MWPKAGFPLIPDGQTGQYSLAAINPDDPEGEATTLAEVYLEAFHEVSVNIAAQTGFRKLIEGNQCDRLATEVPSKTMQDHPIRVLGSITTYTAAGTAKGVLALTIPPGGNAEVLRCLPLTVFNGGTTESLEDLLGADNPIFLPDFDGADIDLSLEN